MLGRRIALGIAATALVGALATPGVLRAGTSGSGSTAPAPSATAAPSGTVLFSDPLTDAAGVARLQRGGRTANCRDGLVDGALSIAKINPALTVGCPAFAPGTYSDVAISVDFEFNTDTTGNTGQWINVDCRRNGDGTGTGTDSAATFYIVNVQPGRHLAGIARTDPGNAVVSLSEVPYAPAPVSPHNVMFVCSGNTLTLTVDGLQLTSARDSTYADGGRVALVGGATNGQGDARFTNLVLSQP